jgi:outer membrane protein TolC
MCNNILAKLLIFIFAVITQLGISDFVQAQEQLTLEEAVQIGLDNNYSILIAENISEIDKNNATLGNAGFLPNLSATASKSRSIEDSRSVFSGSSIPDREDENAQSTSTTAGAQLEWTVFDGLRMFTSYERLQELKNLGEKEARLTIEQTLAEIISSYYSIVQLKKSYEVIENTVDISRERIEIAETQQDLGSGSEYDLLQARADLSADSAALIRQEVALNNAKMSFNKLLARNPTAEFEVSDDIPLQQQLEYAALEQKTLADNLSLSVARTNREVKALEIKEIKGERYPEIVLNGGYNYNKNESASGIFEFNQTEGFTYGISARVDLFDGFNINRRIENAKIGLKNQQYIVEEQENSVQTALSSAYQNYVNALKLVDLEMRNLTNAEQSVDIALERFRLGTINAIELREAQRTLISAENRLIQAQYEAKTTETELLRLSGRLLENKSQKIDED